MKKLMIAAAIVCAAAMTQAAAFTWSSGTAKLYAVDHTLNKGNGSWAAGSVTADRADNAATLTYFLSIYDANGLVGTDEGAVKYGSLGKVNTTMEVEEAEQGKDYTYTLVISGPQSNLRSRGVDGDYNYSNASISWTYNGSVTTPAGGAGILDSVVPSAWDVSGITAAPGPIPPGPVPEPTSGLLMLLGVAGLALRRKQK